MSVQTRDKVSHFDTKVWFLLSGRYTFYDKGHQDTIGRITLFRQLLLSLSLSLFSLPSDSFVRSI